MSRGRLYDDAQLYDLVHPAPWKGELEFYLRQARRRGGRVLELACGTGRLTVPLAAQQVDIVGLDLSETMLAAGRARAERAGVRVQWVTGDMRDFRLGEKFSLIFVPANSFCHLLTRPDVEGCLACVRAHLEPPGRFVVDVFNPSLAILTRDPGRWYEVTEFVDGRGRRTRLSEQNQYDSASQVNHIVWRFEADDGRRTELRLEMRQFFPQELEALLAHNGFVMEARFGQYGEKPFNAASQQQLVIARLA